MPQERSDARRMERELKVKFEWSEADKNLEKEERNKPLDLNTASDNLLSLETRSWKSGDVSAQTQARNIGSSPYKGKTGNGGGFRSRSGGGGFSGGRSGAGRPSSNRPGSTRSGPARRGQ
jgi:ATP-dependent RNA helicase RhlE